MYSRKAAIQKFQTVTGDNISSGRELCRNCNQNTVIPLCQACDNDFKKHSSRLEKYKKYPGLPRQFIGNQDPSYELDNTADSSRRRGERAANRKQEFSPINAWDEQVTRGFSARRKLCVHCSKNLSSPNVSVCRNCDDMIGDYLSQENQNYEHVGQFKGQAPRGSTDFAEGQAISSPYTNYVQNQERKNYFENMRPKEFRELDDELRQQSRQNKAYNATYPY